MGRWWWVVAATALAGWWFWRRHKALKGEARTTPAPAGATAGGAVAALTAAPKASRGDWKMPGYQALPVVGAGTVPPSQAVNGGGKPAPVPPAPKPVNGCIPPKKPTKVKTGSTTRTECRA